jgi:hypothetical protein
MSHTPFTRHFLVDGRYLGSAPAGYRSADGKQETPWSYSFVCGCCGEQWAKSPVTLGDAEPMRWNNLTANCRKCPEKYPSRWRIPGSLWLSFDKSFPESFPKEVLARELDLHWQAYDNDWN